MTKSMRYLKLVEGGTTVKQGEFFTLGFKLYDASGNVVIPSIGQTIEVKLARSVGIVYETTATVEEDVVRFSVDENIGYGTMRLEIKVLEGSTLIQKYPADGWEEIKITKSLDDLGVGGVTSITVEQFRSEFDEAVASLQIDSEVVLARDNETTLEGRLQRDKQELTTRLDDIKNKQLKFVTYDMFDAKLNGVDDDTVAIKACHDFANEYDLEVKQNKGIIVLTDTVNVQTSTDLNGCTILVKGLSEGKKLYNITSKKSTVPVVGFTQNQFTKGSTLIPSLADYKNHLITIISDEVLTVRHDGGNTTNMYKSDTVFITRDGAIVGGQLINDFTTGNLTLTAYPYDEKELIFNGPKISWEFGNVMDSCFVIFLDSRSNIKIKNILIDIPNAVDYDDSAALPGFKGSMMYALRCYRTILENVVSENYTEGVNKSGYVIQMNSMVDVTYNRVLMLNGWGAIGTVNMKDWKIYDSQINRVDAHTGTNGLYCRNCEFIGGWGVFLGYGMGRVLLENCTSELLPIDGRQHNSVVFLGVTYGIIYEGDIIIKNHTVKDKSGNTTPKKLVNLKFTGENKDYNSAYDFKLPNLTVNNLKFESSGGTQLIGYYMGGFSTLITTLSNNGLKIIMPEFIDIRNVKAYPINDSTYFTGVETETGAVSTATAGHMLPSLTKIILKDVEQSIDMKFINGFTTAQLESEKLPKRVLSIRLPNDGASHIKFELLVERCGGSIFFEVRSTNVKIKDSQIAYDVEGNIETFPDKTTIRDSSIYTMASVALTQSLLNNVNLEAINNIIHLLKKDGVYMTFLPFNYAGGERLLMNNFFGNGKEIISSAEADKYYKFVNTAVYKSPTTL